MDGWGHHGCTQVPRRGIEGRSDAELAEEWCDIDGAADDGELWQRHGGLGEWQPLLH